MLKWFYSYFKHSTSDLVEFVQVQQGADSADNYIIDNCVEHDIVIADDIPLARECIRKNASVVGKRGELFDDNNISARLSTRDLMEDLRQIGAVSGGPKPFSDKDKAKFSNTFDRILTKNMKLSSTKIISNDC